MARSNAIAIWASAILVLVSGASAQTYRVTDLGGLSANNSQGQAVSRCGHVAGFGYVTGGPHGFFWDRRLGMRDLGTLRGTTASVATGINASGDLPGYVEFLNDNERAILWVQGKIHLLGVLPGGSYCGANGINEHGDVVGFSNSGNHSGHAVLWHRHGHLQDLGVLPGGQGSEARAVNLYDDVVGAADAGNGSTHAFLWTKRTGMEDLGTLPGGETASANAINDLGQAVGGSDSWLHGRYYCCRAALWDKGKKVVDIGALSDNWATAFGINDSGDVVGVSQWRAFLWTKAKGMQDLNHLISGNSTLSLWWATAINDRGQITGWGKTNNGEIHAFLLTPKNQQPWACK